ncbi:hypothetical protein [Ructibacterium gallinarum]|uniref:Uncharacterized protein n=1 Tax=Ructibacterium gallinarum TaxID=2779355 RepID=A0A9D5R913_9FIRM|nr:hypothetical protein [Ructibacterium gallinarum]MBE5040542.1 hypothetical protein [Ructibacterium gallinarum]
MSRYDASEKNGLLLHAAGCEFLLKECERIEQKLRKRIDKQEEKRKAEFSSILSYRNVEEIRDEYGYGFITKEQCRSYIKLFEKGQDLLNEPLKSRESSALDVLKMIVSDLRQEIRLDRFDAMSPEEQAEERRRAEQSRRESENHKNEIKKKLKMEE